MIPTVPGALSPNLAADAQKSSDQTASPVLRMDPVKEPATWDSLVSMHPDASAFHTAAWAQVLHATYGHTPLYFCRKNHGQPPQLLPVMEVRSPWTGRRGVSLPFTDECIALGATGPGQEHDLVQEALHHGRVRGWKYFEVRGGVEKWPGATPSLAYFGHRLNLTSDESALFAGFDSPVRRAIRKAEGAGLRVERSTTLESVREFYRLHCQTRRRHGVPPQPFRFFESIARYVLAAGKGCVFSVSHHSRVVAAAVFFNHGKQAVYKFGASDLVFQSVRPNDLLMWEAIKWHARCGLTSLHFGRTTLTAGGLRRFKLGFGASEERIEYCRYDYGREAFVAGDDHAESKASLVLRRLPLSVLRFAGNVLYPHMS